MLSTRFDWLTQRLGVSKVLFTPEQRAIYFPETYSYKAKMT